DVAGGRQRCRNIVGASDDAHLSDAIHVWNPGSLQRSPTAERILRLVGTAIGGDNFVIHGGDFPLSGRANLHYFQSRPTTGAGNSATVSIKCVCGYFSSCDRECVPQVTPTTKPQPALWPSSRSAGVSPIFATRVASMTPNRRMSARIMSGCGRPRGTSSLQML